MREPNSFGHRLGWPGLLALIEPEAKPSHVTPERAVVKPEWVAKFRLDLTPADTIGHFGPERLAEVRKFFMPVNGPAQAPQSESSQDKPVSDTPSADADGWVEHKGDKRPVPAGVFVRMKWSNGAETEATMGDIPGNGWSCGGLRITHYRVVKP